MNPSEKIIPKVVKPRNAFVAFLVSLILPGLGQSYNGQLKKGVLYFGILFLYPFVFAITIGSTFFYGLVSILAIDIFLRIYIIIDAVKNAKRQKDYKVKPYNRWYYHLFIAIGMFSVLMIYDINDVLGSKTFDVADTSMSPTFQVGDWLLADMKAYSKNKPDYGDIVLFSRSDGFMYTFRVVGLPNDKLALVDNIVSINSNINKSTFIKETINNDIPVLEFQEELPNGHKHLIYKFQKSSGNTRANIEEIIVPADSYYLLGDNRGASADSRYEGPIHLDRIKGRVMFSYWGQSLNRINIDFTDK